ncbi:hypothetical protein ACFLS9_06960 [Bacteroidota bacterium]
MTYRNFEKKWIKKIEKELLKKFPDEFIRISDSTKISLPETTLILGNEFFGNYEIMDSNGNSYFKSQDIYDIKYILYANRNTPKSILKPKDHDKLISAVKEYERLLDSILKEMEREFKTVFPGSKIFSRTSGRIFSNLNLHRY